MRGRFLYFFSHLLRRSVFLTPNSLQSPFMISPSTLVLAASSSVPPSSLIQRHFLFFSAFSLSLFHTASPSQLHNSYILLISSSYSSFPHCPSSYYFFTIVLPSLSSLPPLLLSLSFSYTLFPSFLHFFPSPLIPCLPVLLLGWLLSRVATWASQCSEVLSSPSQFQDTKQLIQFTTSTQQAMQTVEIRLVYLVF